MIDFNAARRDQLYRDGYWRRETIYQLAAGHAKATPNRIAVTESPRRVSYRDLVAAVDQFAHELAEAGLKPGDRVACWAPSRADVAIALLACSRNGYIFCPSLHRDHTYNEVLGLLERMKAAAFLYLEGYGADGVTVDAPAITARVGLKYIRKLEDAPIGSKASVAAATAAPVATDPDVPVYLAFTSGSTGLPKGVLHSNNTLLSNARAIAQDWNFGPEDNIYTLSQLSHNLGFGAFILAMLTGGEIVLHDLGRGQSLADRLIETNTSFLFGVPTHAIDLLSELEARQISSVGRLRGFRISGAAVSAKVIYQLLQRGILPQSGYGMTEACSHNYSLPSDPPEVVAETSGRTCKGYEIKIFSSDDANVAVETGTIGQICGRGSSLMLGYYDDPAATQGAFNAEGWFMTGDLGWLDAKGYLHITGRKKDLIIRGGRNIYPAHIEGLTLSHPAIQHAVAVPVADERLGEKVCLAVSFKNGTQLTADAILSHLNQAGLSKFDMPEYYLPVAAIPLTPSGKVSKPALLDQIKSGALQPQPVRYKAS